MISSKQIAYVASRFISEGGRLISDILEMTDILNMEGHLLTIDFDKALDSGDHSFLLAILEKYGFKKNFLRWTETLLNNHESCIINGGITNYYFKLKKGARDLCLLVYYSIRSCIFCKDLDIFNHEFPYTAYAGDTTFFLKDKNSR